MTATLDSKARALADTAAGSIHATVEIAVGPERVFRALASEEITQWWGSDDLYRTTQWVGDVRPGGTWRTTGVSATGEPFAVGGEFLEVDAPRRLVMTWVPDWDGSNVTTVSYELQAIPGGTRLTVRHTDFGARVDSCNSHARGWERVLGWLCAFYMNGATS